MMKLSKKIFSLTVCISIMGSYFPVVGASAAPPGITSVYQKDNHVKVEWATQMADSDVLYRTSFEPGQEIPRLTWGGNNIYGNQSVISQPFGYNGGNVLRLTDTISNTSGNWVNYPQTENDTSIFTFSGRSYPNLAVISVNAKVRAVAGTDNMARFLISTGWFKKGFPRTDNNGRTIKFAETVDFNHPPTEFSAYVDGGDISINDKTTFVIVSSHDQNYNYGVIYYDWDAKSKKFIKGPTDVWTQVSPTGIVPTLNKDIFYAGEPILNYREAGTYFPERRLEPNGQWTTISMNAEVGNYGDDYDMEKNGIRAYGIWKTDGELQMDDIKIGYATESEVFRDGQSVYRGYLSDFEDTAAVDKAAPSAPSGGGITIDANRKPVISWNPASDNGTTYQYQIKGYPRNDPATALSVPQSVTVTSGIKGYSIVLDQNPNTVPPAVVTTAETAFTGANPVTGNFYAHIAAIDNQGNMSAVTHLQYTDNIKPTLRITSSNTTWTKGSVTLQVVASDAQTGIKRIQKPDGTWVNSERIQYDVSQNGTYTFTAEDNAGNQQSESITVRNIDREPPKITTSLKERSWSKDDITLQLKYEDGLSGVDPNQMLYKVTNSPDEPQNWDRATGEVQQIQIDQEGEWYIHAKAADLAGNTALIKTKALQLQKQPAAPQLKLVQADETSAKLEWTLPSGATLTDGYRYQLKNVTTGDMFEVQYPNNSFTDPNLSPGQTYEYQVKAANHVGESEYSNTVQVQTLPAAPTEIKIEKVDRQADRALVTILPVESATSYRIIARDSKTQQEVFNEVVHGTKQLVTNLKPGTVYDISAAAINSGGQGQAVHAGFLTLPDEPGAFKAAQIGEKDIYLEWNSVDTAEKYGLDRDEQSIYEGKNTKYHDQDLKSGSRYNYAVSATNATGFGDYSTLENVWTLPAAVEELQGKTVSTTEIDLSWKSVRGATGYIVSVDGQETTLPAGDTAYKAKGLTPGRTYGFEVRAINDSGSGATNTVTVSTLPEAPARAEVSEIQEQTAKLTFAAADGATKYRVVVNGKTYDIADTELQINDLMGGKTYEYSIAAGNSAGFGQELKGTFLTLPRMPGGLSAKEHTARSLTLTWNKTESANGYIVLDDQGNILGTPETNEYTVTGLTPGSENTYLVKAKNASGEGAAAKFSWRTIPDTEASGVMLQVEKIGTHEVEISWSSVPGADGYVLYDEKGQQLTETKELKGKVEQLQSATKYTGWTFVASNSTGKGKALDVPAFETLPTSDYEVKATSKETDITLEFIGTDPGHEIYVVELGGQEIYRGEKPEVTTKNLKSGTKYTFTVWTENTKGEQSEKKNVESTTLKPQSPPMTGGSGGGTNNKPGTTVDQAEKEIPTDTDKGSPGSSDREEKLPFTDLDQAFNRDQIENLYKKGIVQGTSATTFEPKRPITRVEFMSLIVRALDMKSEESGLTFQDIDLEAWYIPELKTAVKNGVAKGFSSTIFRPFDPITREQASKMLGNVLHNKLPDPEGKEIFKDSRNIAFWAKNEVLGLTAEQLITGYPDGTFRPKNNLTRAESVALIYRTLQK